VTRVLVSGVVLSQPQGGVRRHNQELLPRVAELLARRGGSLALMQGKQGLPFELPAEIELLTSNVPARPAIVRATLEGRWLRKHIDAARAAGNPFTLVHTAHLPVPKHLPIPYTLTLHDLRSLAGQHTPMSRRLVSRKLIGEAVRGARAVICVSQSVRAQLLEQFALAPERVHVVPNAADHFTPRARRREPDAPILYVGHLEPRKNLSLLLHALAADPNLPDLVLAGAAKNDEDRRLRAQAASLGIDSRVRLLGAFDDAELPALYAGAGCCVFPAHVEGFCIPVLEAQRAGVPLAVARTPALEETAGADVPTFATDDAPGCARAIRAALDIGEQELERAAERAHTYRWDDSARRWLTVWEGA
jgi:mannosyltransferase